MTETQPDWPPGNGEIARHIRAHDWASTPLGPVERWPMSLRATVDLALSSPVATIMLWGPAHIQIYNDSWRTLMTGKHPAALGQPAYECFPKIADTMAPLYDRAQRGEAVILQDMLLPVSRHGEVKDAWWNVHYLPVRDESGAVAGIFCTVTETTMKVRAEQRRIVAEQALRDSEERHRLAMAAVEAMVFDWDVPSGRVIRSEGLHRLLGHSPEEATETAEWWNERVHPDDLARLGWPAREAMAAGVLRFEARVRVRHREGHWVDVLDTGVILYDADGRPSRVVGSSVDVTARTRVEAHLHESEERFRAFVMASSDVVYRMSADWSEMRQLEGRTFLRNTDEPSQGWLDRYIHPEDQAAVHARIGQAIQTGSMFEMEHKVIRLDGSRGWTLSRAVPLLTAEGDIKEWLGAASDITAKREAEIIRTHTEARLRESEERYLGLYNAIDQGFCTIEVAFDPSGRAADYRFLEVSPSFEAQTGIENAAGKWMREIVPDHDEFWFEVYGRVALTGEPARFEAGSKPLGRWWSVYGYRIGDPAQRTVAVMFSDVTARKRAEDALLASEERLRQFGDASQDVLWIRDTETFQWTYLTPAFEVIYGLDRQAALRGDNMANWVELVVPEDRERAVDSLRRVRDGEWVTFEYRVRRPVDGEVRWLRDMDFPIKDEAGRVVRIGGVGHDITAMKEAEEALAAAEQRQRLLLEGIPQLVWRSGDDGLWTWSSPQWQDYAGQMQEQSHGWGWLDAVHPDDHDTTRRAWHEARSHGRLDVEHRVRRAGDGAWRWHATRSVPVRAAAASDQAEGRILEWLGTTTDIEDLKQLQGQQQVLVAELQHRTRNLLAVVRSVARRSIPPSPERDEYDARLAALGRVQGFLSRSPLYTVPLADLVEAELVATGDGASKKVTVGGPAIDLPGEGVQAVALALHELATNAVKYGALAQAAGRLSVEWQMDDTSPGSRHLVIDWRESRVAMPEGPPTRRGYGSELITKALPYQLKAETELRFTHDGVHCRIILPASAFLASQK